MKAAHRKTQYARQAARAAPSVAPADEQWRSPGEARPGPELLRALADPGSRMRTNVFTRLQRSYGNAAVQGLVQHYQAGETGHGGIDNAP